MEIITYSADPADNAPSSAQAVAYIHLGQTKKGADLGWLPVVFRAPTRDEARSRAQSHWDAELAKAAAKVENRAAMSERRRKPQAEAQGSAVIEEAF